MLALGIRYLCGWSMSTDPADRTRPEWPPHPDRVFMALAAAHFETDGDLDERAALQWLENLGAPSLAVSGAQPRTTTTAFVPVNDSAVPRLKAGRPASADQVANGMAVLPDHRPRQARSFPATVPEDTAVHVLWPAAEPTSAVRQALERLCRKVTHVGHSASLTQFWVDDNPPAETIRPDEVSAWCRLRVPGEGRLADLERRFAAGMRPSQAPWRGYGRAAAASEGGDVTKTVFAEDLIVLRMSGRRLGLESTSQLLDALRATLLQGSVQPPPTWLSGHEADGSPLSEPHMALLALPNVGNQHADGRLLGVAVVLPRTVSSTDAARALRHVILDASGAGGLRVYNGRLLDVTLALTSGGDAPRALQPDTWTGNREHGACEWASVTPIVLDRFPKKDGDAEQIVANACKRIGLPTPTDVVLSHVSRFRGAPPALKFPRYGRAGAPPRAQVHAILRFERPVVGPVLLGAGRFRGYGLCRPLSAAEAER